MHQRKSKKILIYFFLLILVGSINNIKLNELELYNIKKITISGLGQIENSNFKKDIKSLNLNNIFLIDTTNIKKILSENSLIEDYRIFRKYPFTLDFKIKKTNLLARVNKNGKTFIIGSNGRLTKNNFTNKKLPYVFGDADIKSFLELKKILDGSKFNFNEIKNFYFFPSKRWDIELNNNIIVKLPKDNLRNAVDYVFEFLEKESFNNKKMIDLRVKNQIIIND